MAPRKKAKAASEGIAPVVIASEPPKPKPAGYVFGRPTAYLPEFCDKVLEWGAQGKSVTWMAAEIGIDKKTIYNWIDTHPDFFYAIERARVLCQKWWEDAGQNGMTANLFNSTVWQKNMAARFRDEWTERSETALTGPSGGPVQHVVEFAIIDPAENQG
jgi:hypothetical protein